MDPTYQQMMVQALMGQQYAPQGTTGQNAATSYGQNFVTGNGTSQQMGMLGITPYQNSNAMAYPGQAQSQG